MDTTLPLDESIRHSGRAGRMAVWWLTAGPPRPSQPIDESRMTVGRDPEVTASFEAAGLSRCHAEIYRQGPAYIAHDLGSTNGTYVNARRIEYAPLSEGDVIRLGDVVGVVARVPPELAAQRAELSELSPLSNAAPDLWFGPGLAAQLADVRRVAPTDLPVVIVGETGAGKEYVASAVHALGGRRGSFHAVNCAALPTALAEAELFGHARGAFTGAEQAGLGHVRAAEGGTLFLDELPELPGPVQAKLLRVLQDRRVTPLGETRAVSVDLRVVAACQQPIEELVEARRLRPDLAARLAGLTVMVPPLRQRRVDAGLYFGRFLDRHTHGRAPAVDPRLLECLLLHDWPGNLRELELLTRRLVALHGDQPLLRRSFLPESLREKLPADDAAEPAPGGGGGGGGSGAAAGGAAPPVDRDSHDRRRLADELRRHDGNLTRAATAAGISRARAYRLLDGRSAQEFLAEVAAADVKTNP